MRAYLTLRSKNIFASRWSGGGELCGRGRPRFGTPIPPRNFYKIELTKGIQSLIAAQELETALIMQKGYTTYFFLDGDLQWLESLKAHHLAFQKGMEQAEGASSTEQEKRILKKISEAYLEFSVQREVVIQLYKEGNNKAGTSKHWEVRKQFQAIYALCEEFKDLQEKRIDIAHAAYQQRGKTISGFSVAGGFFSPWAAPCSWER